MKRLYIYIYGIYIYGRSISRSCFSVSFRLCRLFSGFSLSLLISQTEHCNLRFLCSLHGSELLLYCGRTWIRDFRRRSTWLCPKVVVLRWCSFCFFFAVQNVLEPQKRMVVLLFVIFVCFVSCSVKCSHALLTYNCVWSCGSPGHKFWEKSAFFFFCSLLPRQDNVYKKKPKKHTHTQLWSEYFRFVHAFLRYPPLAPHPQMHEHRYWCIYSAPKKNGANILLLGYLLHPYFRSKSCIFWGDKKKVFHCPLDLRPPPFVFSKTKNLSLDDTVMFKSLRICGICTGTMTCADQDFLSVFFCHFFPLFFFLTSIVRGIAVHKKSVTSVVTKGGEGWQIKLIFVLFLRVQKQGWDQKVVWVCVGGEGAPKTVDPIFFCRLHTAMNKRPVRGAVRGSTHLTDFVYALDPFSPFFVPLFCGEEKKIFKSAPPSISSPSKDFFSSEPPPLV